MADADPPDEIHNREAPGHWHVHAPDANAANEQVAHGIEKQHHQKECRAEPQPPAAAEAPRQDNRTDLVGDRRGGVTGADHGGGCRLGGRVVKRTRSIAHVAVLWWWLG